MPRHEYYEELAAIAAIGELTPAQNQELDAHLAECGDCREILREYEQLHAPLRERLDAEVETVVESRRDTVKTAVFEAIAASQAQPLDRVAPRRWSAHQAAWRLVASAAAILMAFGLGVGYERNVLGARTERPAGKLANENAILRGSMDSGRSEPPRENSSTDQRYIELAEKWKAEQTRSASLESALLRKETEIGEAQRQRLLIQEQAEAQKEETRRTQASLERKTQQLTQFEEASAADSSTLAALRYQVQDLTEKLSEQTQKLDRERELLANGRDIRDIIGARNLHIIDVYDTDAGGKTRQSFARAFYTEGKSLVFYAYDLPAHGAEDGKFVYAAWGEKNGDRKTVQKLGILLNDDKGQKRWALNFSDPRVLNEIDSVFVTLERVDMNGAEPKGRRMLTAYLDSRVNHP